MTLFTCFLLAVFAVYTNASREEAALRKRLNEYYEETGRETRPVQVWRDNVTVTHGLSILSFDFDAEKKLLSGVFWLNWQWNDIGLRWNRSDYNGLPSIRMRSTDIWIPDILLFNSEEANAPMTDTLLVVTSDGTVLWVPPVTYKVKCSRATEDNLPEGTRFVCKLKFGSWTYDGGLVDMKTNMDTVDISFMAPNDAWDVTFTEARRHAVKYDCCPQTYVDITYKIGLKNNWV